MGIAGAPVPKLLKSAYLASTEALLKETRGTALFYLPGPILAILFFGTLEYGAASATGKYGLPSVYGLTDFFTRFDFERNLGHDALWTVILGLFLLASVLWLLIRYLRWISTVYAVTTHRVIVQRGILGREFDEIPIPQVRGVDVRQSVGQRILRYGTVRVSSETGTSSSIGNEDWEGIPRPFDFQRIIESAGQAIARGAYNVAPPAAPPYPPYPPPGLPPTGR